MLDIMPYTQESTPILKEKLNQPSLLFSMAQTMTSQDDRGT